MQCFYTFSFWKFFLEIYQKFGSFVFIYAIDNLFFVCSYFINDCLLVFNTLIFEIYISLVFAVVFL